MLKLTLLAIIIILTTWGGLKRRSRRHTVKPAQIPLLIDTLKHSIERERWAMLMFCTPDRPDGADAINLQLSIESSMLGVDWFLVIPRNIEEREEFVRFAEDRGYRPCLRHVRDLPYLRIEGPDLGALVASILEEMYGIASDDDIDMECEGFDWPRPDWLASGRFLSKPQ